MLLVVLRIFKPSKTKMRLPFVFIGIGLLLIFFSEFFSNSPSPIAFLLFLGSIATLGYGIFPCVATWLLNVGLFIVGGCGFYIKSWRWWENREFHNVAETQMALIVLGQIAILLAIASLLWIARPESVTNNKLLQRTGRKASR